MGTPEHRQILAASANVDSSKVRSSRRSQLEIRMDILRSILEGAEGPTQIMYNANLSWTLLCDQLETLGRQGFVGEKDVGSRKKFSLTDKGIEIVSVYLNLWKEFMGEEGMPNVGPLEGK